MATQTSLAIPCLQRRNKTWELTVDGEPFLILGGQVQNSSMSSSRHMETAWENIRDMGINTVLGAVTWEQIEQVEDQFDFEEFDKILVGAQKHGLRMVALWFGSFKNGASSYAPSWVKTNPKRFPRMQTRKDDGTLEVTNALSIFSSEVLEADTKAFLALINHIKEVDEEHRTVIMIQIQNEVGLLGDSRDRSASTEKIFRGPVPASLIDFLERNWDTLHPDFRSTFAALPETIQRLRADNGDRSWTDYFGDRVHTDEVFMAYHYAAFLEKTASSAKQCYDLPLYANVWVRNSPTINVAGVDIAVGTTPGNYPSGGAVSTVLDIWQATSRTIDFIAPDIYTVDYTETLQKYSHRDQPIFIPEQRRDEFGLRRIWEAIGTYGAFGVSPFGVDTILAADSPVTKHYKLLQSVLPHIIEARRKPESIFGFFFDEKPIDGPDPKSQSVRRFGDNELLIKRAFVFGKQDAGFGIVIEKAPGRFLLMGEGFEVEFKSTDPDVAFTGILRFTEMSVKNSKTGALQRERALNGDQSHSGRVAVMPSENPDLGDWFIPSFIPAKTRIAEVEVYSLHKEDIK